MRKRQIVTEVKPKIYLLFFIFMLVILSGISQQSFSAGVDIWGADGWTTAFSNGSPIDTGPRNAYFPQVAVAPNGFTYVTYFQIDDTERERIYLSRYNGTNVQIWGENGWTTNLEEGIPIDPATGEERAYSPELAIDSNNNVYITYIVPALFYHVYLNRYDDSEDIMQIWAIEGEGPAAWTPIPLDDGITPVSINGEEITLEEEGEGALPQITVDSNDIIYITYSQHILGQLFGHVSLNRYDDDEGVQVWGEGDWTNALNAGVTIDPNTGSCAAPVLAVDYSNNNVYIAYTHLESLVRSTFLNRYDGTDVRIWDNDTGDWVTNFADGDSIDPGNGLSSSAQIAVDSQSRVYITYVVAVDGGLPGIYLNRYSNEEGVQIWDNELDPPCWNTETADVLPITPLDSTALSPHIAIDSNNVLYISYTFLEGGALPSRICLNKYDDDEGMQVWGNDGWTNTLNAGIPIDSGTQNCGLPELAVDLNNNVYIAYAHLEIASTYLNRYNGTDVQIWDNDTSDWVNNFANGDSIDPGDGYALVPQIAIDFDNVVYVTYMYGQGGMQKNNGFDWRVYLSRYVQVVSPEDSQGPDDEEDNPCFLEEIFHMAKTNKRNDGIIVLKQFRDKNLLTNPVGKIFVSTYYKVSPLTAEFVKECPLLKNILGKFLSPVVWFCERALEENM